MKLKYTTKLFIVVNAIVSIFRTLQIMRMTEPKTAFLKDDFTVVSIIGEAISVIAIVLLFINASQAVRQPEKINCKGVLSAVAAGITGVLYLLSGLLSALNRAFGWQMILLTAILSAVSAALMIAAAFSDFKYPKFAALLPITFWLTVLLTAYIKYTERALRVRTVYEIFAICAVVLFLVSYGKAISGVNPKKNFRMLYPLGLTAATLCIASVLPEAIAFIFGKGANVSSSAVSVAALAAGAVFTGFFTINTFKKSNTVHPKKKMMMENSSSDSEN